MNWYIQALKNSFDFSGRARRKEYWLFTLFNTLIMLALAVGAIVTGSEGSVGIFGALYALYAILMIIPNLSLSFRRLHDTGRSAWWMLISLVPLVGGIVLFVFLVTDSEPGSNAYGPNPKD